MKLVTVTGMSGVGKTIISEMLEGMGFYCVDNLPMSLVDKFAQLASGGGDIAQAALGIDVGGSEELNHLDEILRGWKNTGLSSQILFLDASDATLIRRYKETHRSYSLTGTGRPDKGAEKEQVKLTFLKKDVSFTVDTSELLIKKLRQELEKTLFQDRECSNMLVAVLSSGLRYGISEDMDLVFDVRLPPSPYYMEELCPLIGEDQVIHDYVIQGGIGQAFPDKLYDMTDLLLSNYIGEGENQSAIVVRYIGNERRFVAMANTLYEHLATLREYGIKIEHRDIDKDNKRKR